MSGWPSRNANSNAVSPSASTCCTSAPFCDRKREWEVESDREWRPSIPSPRRGSARAGWTSGRSRRAGRAIRPPFDDDRRTSSLYSPRGEGGLGGGESVRWHGLDCNALRDASEFVGVPSFSVAAGHRSDPFDLT